MPNNAGVCRNCRGEGWFHDTTYDRCGVLVKCDRCHGSGLRDEAVKRIIENALTAYVLPRPKE